MVAKKPVKRKLSPDDGRLLQNRKKIEPTKIATPTKTPSGDIMIERIYCRRCMEEKKQTEFFKTTDIFLDKNGYMSICKDCCQDIYVRYYQVEHSVDRAMLRLCRTLNWKYGEDFLNSMKKQLQNSNKTPDDPIVPSIYIMKLFLLGRTAGAKFGEKTIDVNDLVFREPDSEVKHEIGSDAFGEDTPGLKIFWGESFSYEDYIFLEAELAQWKNSHKADTYAEISLLKELCYKELEIRKARIETKTTGTLVKEKQDLMKTASVDPAKANMASSGKSFDTFSSFIKTIEETEPAEYYKDKGLFKDFDNIEFYFEKYVRRPLKNFITGSRDFNVDAEENEEEFDDYDKQIASITEAEEPNDGETSI